MRITWKAMSIRAATPISVLIRFNEWRSNKRMDLMRRPRGSTGPARPREQARLHAGPSPDIGAGAEVAVRDHPTLAVPNSEASIRSASGPEEGWAEGRPAVQRRPERGATPARGSHRRR